MPFSSIELCFRGCLRAEVCLRQQEVGQSAVHTDGLQASDFHTGGMIIVQRRRRVVQCVDQSMYNPDHEPNHIGRPAPFGFSTGSQKL
jgi:hypothetical protein